MSQFSMPNAVWVFLFLSFRFFYLSGTHIAYLCPKRIKITRSDCRDGARAREREVEAVRTVDPWKEHLSL